MRSLCVMDMAPNSMMGRKGEDASLGGPGETAGIGASCCRGSMARFGARVSGGYRGHWGPALARSKAVKQQVYSGEGFLFLLLDSLAVR